MTKRSWIFLLLACAMFSLSVPAQSAPASSASTASASSSYVWPDAHTRRVRYVKSMFGLESVGMAIAGAGISTARNSPPEWGPHWEGYGKRFASNMGRRVIEKTVQFGLGEALRLDSNYYVSHGNARSKIVNAFRSPFTARTPSGKRVIGVPRLASIYAANIIATEAWYPDRYTWKDGVRNGTTAVGLAIAMNLVKEFIFRK